MFNQISKLPQPIPEKPVILDKKAHIGRLPTGQATYPALTVWFLAIYLVSQVKTGLFALELMRELGGELSLSVDDPSQWLKPSL